MLLLACVQVVINPCRRPLEGRPTKLLMLASVVITPLAVVRPPVYTTAQAPADVCHCKSHAQNHDIKLHVVAEKVLQAFILSMFS
jgi:hypothetical protein